MEAAVIAGLIRQASDAMQYSYAPYSRFRVGAALLAEDGSIFTGVNVENAAYPAGICAERTAFSKAVSQGLRQFRAIAIVGAGISGSPADFCYPCGFCRQVMAEFCGGDFVVIAALSPTEYRVMTLGELLPCSFGKNQLES